MKSAGPKPGILRDRPKLFQSRSWSLGKWRIELALTTPVLFEAAFPIALKRLNPFKGHDFPELTPVNSREFPFESTEI